MFKPKLYSRKIKRIRKMITKLLSEDVYNFESKQFNSYLFIVKNQF